MLYATYPSTLELNNMKGKKNSSFQAELYSFILNLQRLLKWYCKYPTEKKHEEFVECLLQEKTTAPPKISGDLLPNGKRKT